MYSRLLKFSDKKIKKLAFKNYYSARFYHNLISYFENFRAKEMILVYQMGKVGSSTVVKSLKSLGITGPVFNVHSFTEGNLNRAEQIYKIQFHRHPYSPRTLWDSQKIRKQLLDRNKGKRWKIVTLVRDPIARSLSLFFGPDNMIIEKFNGQYKIKSNTYSYEIIIRPEDTKILLDLFLTKVDHNRPTAWFDNELRRFSGIDIFSTEFPKSKGYNIYCEEHVKLLLIRLENLNDVADDAFKEFLGIENLSIKDTNIGTKKHFGNLYRTFKESIKLPDSYVEMMYKSRYAKHFYSEEEINMFKKRWM
jgi:hypothetical protein